MQDSAERQTPPADGFVTERHCRLNDQKARPRLDVSTGCSQKQVFAYDLLSPRRNKTARSIVGTAAAIVAIVPQIVFFI